MKLPIPQDWDGTSWQCVQIEWPDSVTWSAILIGLITRPEAGRSWDERSGLITDAQVVGSEIYRRNFPFVDCGGEPIIITKEKIIEIAGAFDGEESENEMSCSIPYGALKWVGGVLYYRYCGDWYPVEGQTTGDTGITEEYIPPEIEGGGYSACGKATAVMDMVYGVISSILDEVGNFAWQWWGHIKADNPGVGMDAKWIITACYGAVNQHAADVAAAESYDPDALDPSTWQSVKCALAREFTDTMPEPLGGNEIRSKLQTLFASEWGLDLLTNAIFVDALRGINRESFELAVANGASYDASDCDCPTEGEVSGDLPPVLGGWYLGQARTVTINITDTKEDSYTPICFVPSHDVYGLVHSVEVLSITSHGLDRYSKAGDLTTDCAHDVQLTDHAGTAEYYPGNLYFQMDDSPATTLYDALTTSLTKAYDVLADRSKVVAMPIAEGGQTCQVLWFGEANTGGSGQIRITYRLVHNTNSPSHVIP